MSKKKKKTSARDAALAAAAELGRQGHLDQAAGKLLELAQAERPDYDFLLEIGRELEAVKRFGKAHDVYCMAMRLDMDNYVAYARLGALFVEMERPAAGVVHLEKAVELAPGVIELHYNLGLAAMAAQDYEKARVAMEKTIELGGPTQMAYGNLARLFEQTNQMDELEKTLKKGLKDFPDDPFLNFNMAVFDRRAGNAEAALKRLLECEAFLDRAPEAKAAEDWDEHRILVNFELARCYDKLGKVDEAYSFFEKGNGLSAKRFYIHAPDKGEALRNIGRLKALDLGNWREQAADPLDDAVKTPVFLVGFPRSGTTLLQQILDGHSKIKVIEEQPVLATLAGEINEKLGGYPEALKTINKAQFNDFRDEYLKALGQFAPGGEKTKLIDKLPLNITQVPLILKLFPEAKFILALRHPCDSSLSCFMQNFMLNNAMSNFLTLDDTTRYYEEVFSLWFGYVEQLAPDFHAIRYEDVVADLEKEAKAAIAFLGLPWEEGVLEYRKQAKAKTRISTPSYSQVVQPIYKDAAGRWKRYETFLKPYLGRLQPFCDAFGYSL